MASSWGEAVVESLACVSFFSPVLGLETQSLTVWVKEGERL